MTTPVEMISLLIYVEINTRLIEESVSSSEKALSCNKKGEKKREIHSVTTDLITQPAAQRDPTHCFRQYIRSNLYEHLITTESTQRGEDDVTQGGSVNLSFIKIALKRFQKPYTGRGRGVGKTRGGKVCLCSRPG